MASSVATSAIIALVATEDAKTCSVSPDDPCQQQNHFTIQQQFVACPTRSPEGQRDTPVSRSVNVVTEVIVTPTGSINHDHLGWYKLVCRSGLDKSTCPPAHSRSIPIVLTGYTRCLHGYCIRESDSLLFEVVVVCGLHGF